MLAKSITAALVLAASVQAHFSIEYPEERGDADDAQVNFCAGFNTASTERTPFPLSGSAPIHLDSHHDVAATAVIWSNNSNPTSFDQFSATFLKSWFYMYEGDRCFNVDFSTVGGNFQNGSLVTIQVQQNGGDGNLFNCADLILIDGYQVPSDETCSNDVSLASNATVSSTPASGTTATAINSASMSMSMSMGSATTTAASGTRSAAAATSTGAAKELRVGMGVVGGVMALVAGLAL